MKSGRGGGGRCTDLGPLAACFESIWIGASISSFSLWRESQVAAGRASIATLSSGGTITQLALLSLFGTCSVGGVSFGTYGREEWSVGGYGSRAISCMFRFDMGWGNLIVYFMRERD